MHRKTKIVITIKQIKTMKEFKGSVWCVFALFAALLGWLMFHDNPYLNAIVLPYAIMVVLLAVAWLQETEFGCTSRFGKWFLG